MKIKIKIKSNIYCHLNFYCRFEGISEPYNLISTKSLKGAQNVCLSPIFQFSVLGSILLLLEGGSLKKNKKALYIRSYFCIYKDFLNYSLTRIQA